MISFTELLPRLVNVTKLTERDHEYQCPRCGGRATIRSFGRGWSAKCPRCGDLGEDDFRISGQTVADIGDGGGGVGQATGDAPQPSLAPASSAAQPSSGPSHRLSSNAAPENASAGRGTLADGPDAAAQPAHEEVMRSGSSQDSSSEPGIQRSVVTASVGEADADAGIHASEEVREHIPRTSKAGNHNAAPAAGLNGAGGGRYKPDVDSWKLAIYTRARDQTEDLLHKGTADSRAAAEMIVQSSQLENWIATVNQQRNLPQDNLTYDPALKPTEIQEEIEVLARALQQRYAPLPAVQNGHVSTAQPLVIPWEGFNQALIANEAYLKRVAIVDRLCFSSSVAMITGGKHAGKSTLARWMAVCVAKGWPFLGRDVSQGPVFYVASEDETMAARQELIRLGWGPDDPLRFLSAQNIPYENLDEFLARLTDEIRAARVVMCVLDMLFDFVRIADEMSYAATREAVGKIQNVASYSESLIVTSHHAPKHMNTADAAVTALGSQGLAARVSPIILVKKHGPDVHSIVSTSVRDPRGEAIEQSRLVRNSDGSMTLGGIWKDWMQAEVYRPQVLEVLGAEDDAEMTAADVAEQLEITYKLAAAALVRLYKDGKVARKGSGLKGKPYRYQIISESNPKKPENDVSQGKGAIHSEPPPHPNAQGAFGYKED